MFYTIEVVDCLLNADNNLLLNLSGPSTGVGHSNADVIDRNSRKDFLAHILRAEQAADQNKNHHQVRGDRVAYKPGNQPLHDSSPAAAPGSGSEAPALAVGISVSEGLTFMPAIARAIRVVTTRVPASMPTATTLLGLDRSTEIV